MSLPGFAWIARPDRAIPGLDPLNAWLAEDGFDFLELGLGPIGEGKRLVDVTASFGGPPTVTRSLREPSFTKIAPISSRKSALPQEQTVAAPRSLDTSRQFLMPLSQRSIGDDPNRLSAGFQDIPWIPPAGVAPENYVIVGVIDHAINIAHRRFQHATGSRVDFAWIQDGRGLPERPVPFGRVWQGSEIETAAALDTESAFDALELVDFASAQSNPLALGLSHGTHVADIAAGADYDDPSAASQRMITVTLPAFVAQETSGGLLSLFFIQGLDFLLRQARMMSRAVGRAIPVVINFSFSVSGGPRSGGHFIEQQIKTLFDLHTEILTQEGLSPQRPEIFMPSGNRNLARCHAAKAAVDGALDICLPWRVQPEDQTASYVEIWLPPKSTDISVTVSAPGFPGLATTVPLADATPVLLTRPDDDSQTLARLSLDAIDGRQRIFLSFAPTLVQGINRAALPAGLWTIRVQAVCQDNGVCEAWVMRDDTPQGFKALGRQSYFDDPLYERFTDQGDHADVDPDGMPSLVRRAGTSNGLATGQDGPFLVSGFRAQMIRDDNSSQATALYSATTERCHKKHLGAISDRSRVLSGVIAAGTFSGSRRAMNGTSVATPQAVRQRASDLSSSDAIVAAGGLQTVLDGSLEVLEHDGVPLRGVRGVLTNVIPSKREQMR